MYRRCCYCSANLGDIEPLEDKRTSDGICISCMGMLHDIEENKRLFINSKDKEEMERLEKEIVVWGNVLRLRMSENTNLPKGYEKNFEF